MAVAIRGPGAVQGAGAEPEPGAVGVQVPEAGARTEHGAGAIAVAVAGTAAVPGAGTAAVTKAIQGARIPPAVRGTGETRTMQKSECRYQKSEFPEGEGLSTRGRGRSQKAEARCWKSEVRTAVKEKLGTGRSQEARGRREMTARIAAQARVTMCIAVHIRLADGIQPKFSILKSLFTLSARTPPMPPP